VITGETVKVPDPSQRLPDTYSSKSLVLKKFFFINLIHKHVVCEQPLHFPPSHALHSGLEVPITKEWTSQQTHLERTSIDPLTVLYVQASQPTRPISPPPTKAPRLTHHPKRKGRKWFDCAECHAEQESHPLMQSFDMVSVCPVVPF